MQLAFWLANNWTSQVFCFICWYVLPYFLSHNSRLQGKMVIGHNVFNANYAARHQSYLLMDFLDIFSQIQLTLLI
jgi:hypothetical protein